MPHPAAPQVLVPGERLRLRAAYEPLPDWAEAGYRTPGDHALARAVAAMAFHACRIAQARQAIRGWTAHGGPLARRMVASNRRSLAHHRRGWAAAGTRCRQLAGLPLPGAHSPPGAGSAKHRIRHPSESGTIRP